MNIAILIGRAGSKGFPGKNITPLLGRPVVEYPLLAGLNAKKVDKVYVSSDSKEIMDIGRRLGTEIIDRPAHLCTDEALGDHVFLHAYEYAKEHNDEEIETIVLLLANSPTIVASTIDEGIEVLRSRPEVDSAVTVSRYNMWSPLRARREDKDGLLQPFVPFEALGDPEKLSCDRDSQGDVWFADMGVSIVRPRCLENLEHGLLPQKWMGRKIFPLKQWGGLDIDYQWQMPLVEYWLKEHGFSETGTPYDS